MIVTIAILVQQYFKSSINKANIIPFPDPEDGKQLSDYDLVLANFRMKLEVRCCPKSIRICFDLDTLKEPEIEPGVPDSDCWKLAAFNLIDREIDTIANDIKEGLLVTVEEVPWRKWR